MFFLYVTSLPGIKGLKGQWTD